MMNRFAAIVLACACFNSVTLESALAENWPQFRGPASNGVAKAGFPEEWTSTENVRWKIPLKGEGWSCPVVWGNQLFLTSATRVDQGDNDSSRPEPYRGGGGRRRTDLTKATYRWDVICLDTETGRVRWRKTAREGNPPIPRHSSNSYATETPVTDGKRVYAYFGMTGLFCYDMESQLLWQKDLGTFEMRAGWGTSSSPVLFGEKLFLQVDNEQKSFVVALEAKTGDEIWRKNREEPSQYSSPIVWQNSQRAELITGGQICRSYDPDTGDLLWKLNMQKGRSSATPLALGDWLYVGTELRNRGGSDDGGGFLFAVKAGGTGDISLTPDEESSPDVSWKLAGSGIQMASPVLCKGHLYLLERRSGVLHCINAESGKRAYRVRIPGARAFWASPWTNNESVFCLDDSGTTHVLAGGPKYRKVRDNVIDEQSWSTPAISDNAIYLRTIDHLYCIAKKEE